MFQGLKNYAFYSRKIYEVLNKTKHLKLNWYEIYINVNFFIKLNSNRLNKKNE